MERRGRGMLQLLALHALSEYHPLPWKPPVSGALLATSTLIYLRPAFLHSYLLSIDQVWINSYLILKYEDLGRFFLSAFDHVGDSHLETSMGSAEFASKWRVVSLPSWWNTCWNCIPEVEGSIFRFRHIDFDC